MAIHLTGEKSMKINSDANDLVVIGEHKVRPSDLGLIESLRQRGYEVSFRDVLESQPHEQELVADCVGQPGKSE